MIVGIRRHGASLEPATSRLRLVPDVAGKSDLESRAEVVFLRDTDAAIIARIEVENDRGRPVKYARELVFLKGKHLLSRELLEFMDDFDGSVSAIWNTRKIDELMGEHWAMTSEGLLVFFAPQEGWRLQLVRSGKSRIQHVWNGSAKKGDVLHSTQVIYPFPPSSEHSAKTAANRIRVVRDDPEATLLRTTFLRTTFPGAGAEWTLFNPSGKDFYYETFETDARYAVIRTGNYFVDRCVIADGTYLRWHGDDIVRYEERTTEALEFDNP